MVSLNHKTLPHLIDSIFDNAPTESLAVMAKTCVEWRQRSLSQFHLIRDLYIWQSSTTVSADFTYPDRSFVELDQEELGLLAGCRVLCITELWKHKASEDDLFELCRFLPNLDTIKFHFGSLVWCFDSIPALPVRQLVFENGMAPLVGCYSEIKRVIINFGGWDGFEVEQMEFSALTGLEELILLFDGLPHQLQVCADYYSEYDSEPVSDSSSAAEVRSEVLEHAKLQLRNIRRSVQAAIEQGATVILIGLEDWTQRHFDGLELGIERTYASPEDAFAHKLTVSLLTTDEYRDFIGEKEWAVQTSWEAEM